MVVYIILDGHPPDVTTCQNGKDLSRNSVYVQILEEILRVIGIRSKELKVEVYWGNQVCVRATTVSDTVTLTAQKTIDTTKGNLHLGRLFNKIRPKMKNDDVVVLLTDAATFKGDITSYPTGMFFAIVVDLMPANADQFAELNELATTSNSDKFSEVNSKQWVLRYSEFSDVTLLVDELMKSLLEPDFTTLYVGNLNATISLYPSPGRNVPDSIEVVGFVRSANMVNIPVDSVHFITASSAKSKGSCEAENCPPDSDDHNNFVRTEEQSSDDLLGTMGPALLEAESVAIVLINESKFGCISAEKVGEDFCLILNRFPEKMPDFVPDFSTLVSGPDEQGEPLHFTTLQGVAPSYGPVVQSWVREHGFHMDFQKMMRLLRKLPDRPHLFYQEVNRFRKYALAIGMDEILRETARILREEIVPLNATAQKHGAYVATAFEMENPRDTLEIAQL